MLEPIRANTTHTWDMAIRNYRKRPADVGDSEATFVRFFPPESDSFVKTCTLSAADAKGFIHAHFTLDDSENTDEDIGNWHVEVGGVQDDEPWLSDLESFTTS